MPKVSALTSASTPLAGTETVYLVQGGNSRKATVADILGAPSGTSSVKLQTQVVASGQTELQQTGIPSWVNRVGVHFNDLSTSGTSPVQIQLGDSGGYEVTGYRGSFTSFNVSALSTSNASAGAQVETGSLPVAAAQRNGTIWISRQSGDTWAIAGSVGQAQTTANTFVAVNKTLTAALDRVRVIAVNGTDTFDAGSVSFSWE